MKDTILPLDPLSDFVIIMAVIFLMPRFFEKMKLPGILGLFAAGALLGPNLLGILSPERELLKFLGTVGKLMVMFFAGLEIDVNQIGKTGKKSLVYGLTTFSIPLLTGAAVAYGFGYSWNSAVLVGSLLASHTLIAFPILQKYNVVRREPVAVTIGATMFTDVAALMVLAVCVPMHVIGFSPKILAIRFIGLSLYIPAILFGASALARYVIPKIKKDDNLRTVFMLLVLSIAAVGAEAIHLEGIVGAFLCGLAVSELIHEGETHRKLEILGNTLFIPMFFIIVGCLIDPFAVLRMAGSHLGLVMSITGGLVLSKFIAAKLAGKLLNYSNRESKLMWSLSIP